MMFQMWITNQLSTNQLGCQLGKTLSLIVIDYEFHFVNSNSTRRQIRDYMHL